MAKSKGVTQSRYAGSEVTKGKARGKNRKFTRKGNTPARTSSSGNGARIKN